MASVEATQFAFRAAKEMGVCNAPPSTSVASIENKPTEEVRALKYSPNGKYLAWAIASEVRIVDAQTLETLAVIAHMNVADVRFSPNGTYLMTWERYSKKDSPDADNSNLKVWDAATGTLLGGFVQNSFSVTALQWTDDEKYCAKLFRGEVRFFLPTALNKAALTLKLDGITEFSVSPGLSPSVVVFVPERGSKPGLVRMYGIGNFARPVANKTFFKADKVEFYWHRLGTNLLVLTQTEVDKTGRSYYGESGLYFMAAAGNFDCRVVLDRDGPIHDVVWSPDEKEFVVSYGFMPAKTAMFNHRAELVFDFGIAPRNFVRYNPHGRVLAIAGLGNLSGQVDLWDRKKLKKITSVDAHGASFCEWSPDGRYLLAATLSPRLRVDNGIRIWHYSGTLVYKQDTPELYQVDWRPAPVARFPQRSALSPVPAGIALVPSAADAATTAAAKPAGAYRPPHARTREVSSSSSAPRSISDMAERKVFGATAPSAARVVPGAAPKTPKLPVGASPDMLAKAGADKKRRTRNRSKKATGEGAAADSAAEHPSTAEQPSAVEAAPTTEIDILKKVRALKKKVGQIDSLAKKRDAGEVLEANQLAKIAARGQIDAEIAELNAKIASLAV